MPRMAHVYIITLEHADTQAVSEPIEIHAQDQYSALRLAHRVLELDDTWQVRECRDLGAWNKQPGV